MIHLNLQKDLMKRFVDRKKFPGKNRVPTSALTMAPVEVGPVLREQLTHN